MFGSKNTLNGTVYTHTYITGEGKNIRAQDLGIHVTAG